MNVNGNLEQTRTVIEDTRYGLDLVIEIAITNVIDVETMHLMILAAEYG